jgi:hypothetical protein
MLRIPLIALVLLFAFSPICFAANGGVGGARKADGSGTVIVNEPAQDALIRVFGGVELKELKVGVDGVFVAQPIKGQGALDPPPGVGNAKDEDDDPDEISPERLGLSLSNTGGDYSAPQSVASAPFLNSPSSAAPPNPEPSGALVLSGGLAGIAGFALRRLKR